MSTARGEIGDHLHEEYVARLGNYIDHQSRNEVKRIRTQRMEARKQELRVDWVTGGGSYATEQPGSKGNCPHWC